jgi:phosphate-selective porin OprO/OprP
LEANLVKRRNPAIGSRCCCAALAIVLTQPCFARDAAGEGWTFDLTGRLQVAATIAEADLPGFSDSWIDAEVRRARIGVEGERGPLAFEVEIAADGDELLWEDLWAAYDFGPFSLGAGQRKAPVTLEEMTSSRFIIAFERASVVEAFGFERRLGAYVIAGGDRHTFEAGLFAGNAANDEEATAEGAAAAARATFNPVLEDALIVHLGASAQHREAADGQLLRYRTRPRIHLSDRFVDTGPFADADTFVGVEAGAIAGRLHLLAELGALAAESAVGDADLAGGYLEGGVFLTSGDMLGYKDGVIERTQPSDPVNEGGSGAWQLRGRLDWIDLTDGPVAGGVQTSYTIGVNWFATDYVRFVSELTHADIEDGPEGSGEVDSASVRAAIDW